MGHAVNDEALDILFRSARTYNKFLDKPVTPQMLMAIYELMRLGPTTSNSNPARVVFVVSPAAKERLKPHLSTGNRDKTMVAPATAIIAYDLDFAENLTKLQPTKPNAKDGFKDPVVAERHAFRNSALQGAYFILAARALGLDCGPMSGFNNEGVDKEFFPDGRSKSNFLCNIGYGDASDLQPRKPRLSFDEACQIL